uniref:Uncharacterized protein n=1 Tax=Grammatophora oceanica TaxID=210454 RepID=A0A7S1UPG7_9STRA|mmetsp:Transcript_15432/g.22684  ORF Transcript_15432/g.22684 Transcript_15432/m.22684 type:complete len:150 (+) Transcript_15432:549-998(+)
MSVPHEQLSCAGAHPNSNILVSSGIMHHDTHMDMYLSPHTHSTSVSSSSSSPSFDKMISSPTKEQLRQRERLQQRSAEIMSSCTAKEAGWHYSFKPSSSSCTERRQVSAVADDVVRLCLLFCSRRWSQSQDFPSLSPPQRNSKAVVWWR